MRVLHRPGHEPFGCRADFFKQFFHRDILLSVTVVNLCPAPLVCQGHSDLHRHGLAQTAEQAASAKIEIEEWQKRARHASARITDAPYHAAL